MIEGCRVTAGTGAGATDKVTGAGLGVEAGMMMDGVLMARTGAGTSALINFIWIVYSGCMCMWVTPPSA